MTKAAVFPDPDCACPMRLRGGFARMRGRASSWMADGRSNPISKIASRRCFGKSSSWNVRAEDRWEDASDCTTWRRSCLFSYNSVEC